MSSVPVAPSPQTAVELAKFIFDSGYTEAQLKAFGLTKTPWKTSERRALLSHKVQEDSLLGLLIRLFFFGEAVPAECFFAACPVEKGNNMLQAGMFRQEGDQLVPSCMLTHFGKLILACDSVRRAQSGSLNDLVLGVNRPTRILDNCMVRLRPGVDILDLGTGCGTLAFQAAPAAGRIIGTDINERALEFARFNGALNGISNFEARVGDRFEPVKEDRFDLIISNPPFFLTQASKLLFTDNPFHLDSFVESLARQAPSLLKEGGYFQMLCEWVQIKGTRWQERLEDWFRGSGCDVLVLKAYEISPADYSLLRASEAASLLGPSTPETLSNHVHYLEQSGTENICGGLVTIRRSTAWPDGSKRSRNWFVVDQMEETPSAPIGKMLLDRFQAEVVLSSDSDSRLLNARPRLAEEVILVQEAVQTNKSWKAKTVYLERRSGLARRLGFDEEIAQILALWDGSQTLDFLIEAYAKSKNLSKKQIAPEWLRLARKLGSLGLLTFA